MPYGVPYGGRGGGRAALRPSSRRRARGGAVSLRFSGGCLEACFCCRRRLARRFRGAVTGNSYRAYPSCSWRDVWSARAACASLSLSD